MAKYLLVGIAAQYIHTNLATRALSHYLGDHPYDLSVRDFTINQSVDYVFGELIRENPEVVFFSCYIWNRTMCDRLAARLKRALPDLTIIYGGPEASWQAEALLEAMPELDGILCGEGEVSFKTFLEMFEKTGKMGLDVPGLMQRTEKGYYKSPEASLLPMADLPLPYAEGLTDVENRIVYYESSRGCPYRCAYCLSSLDKTVRERPLDQVYQDLQRFLDAKVPQVKFIDRTFNADGKRALAIWNFIKEQDNGVTNFHFEVTADILTDEALDFLKTLPMGLVQFEMGVQSTHLPTLKAVHRSNDMARLAEVVARLHEGENIHLHLDLIAGLPYEGWEAFRQSFNEVFVLKPYDLQLGFLKVLPGTELHAKAEEYGLRYDPVPPYEILATTWLSARELCKLREVETVLGVYHNKGRFQHSLAYLLNFFESPFDFFVAMASCWQEKDLFGRHTGVKDECDALLELVKKHAEMDQGSFDRSLALDLYLREKPRRMPAWLGNYGLSEHEARQFLEQDFAQGLLEQVGVKQSAKSLARNYFMAYFPKEELAPIEAGHYLFCYDDRDLYGNAKIVFFKGC